jgi:hypothetical protein
LIFSCGSATLWPSAFSALKIFQAASVFSRPIFPDVESAATFIRPAGAGLAPITANQFKSASISVELLVVAMLRCALGVFLRG